VDLRIAPKGFVYRGITLEVRLTIEEQ